MTLSSVYDEMSALTDSNSNNTARAPSKQFLMGCDTLLGGLG